MVLDVLKGTFRGTAPRIKLLLALSLAAYGSAIAVLSNIKS